MRKSIPFVLVVALVGCVANRKPLSATLNVSSVSVQREVVLGDEPQQLVMSFECDAELVEYFPGKTPGETTRKVVRPSSECEGRQPLEVTLVSPWGTTAVANLEKGLAKFDLDWSNSGIDPLSPEAGEQLQAGWRIVSGNKEIAGFLSAEVATEAIAFIANADGIDISSAQEERNVRLRIKSFEVAPARVEAGSKIRVSVALHNEGPGTAFRARVVTRSSVASLHNKGVAFGKITAGQTVLREFDILVPAAETESGALLIASIEEANFTHSEVSKQRISIVPASPMEVKEAKEEAGGLVMKCYFEGKAGEKHPELDVEGTIKARCVIRNVGASPASVVLGAAVEQPNKVLAQSSSKDLKIEPGKVAIARFEFRLPAQTSIGDSLTIVAQLNDVVRSRIVGVVRKVGVCPSGPISRSNYKKKRAELVKARDAGALSGDEFDQYDAALVLCIE